jgi:hypothetical protein
VTKTYLALLAVGAAAIVLSLIQRGVERALIPLKEGEERPPLPWIQWLFSDLLFYSLVPGVAYVFFSPYMPFMGFRAGLALALIGILVGVLPVTARELLLQQRRTVLVLFNAFFVVVKLLVCLALMGVLFPL